MRRPLATLAALATLLAGFAATTAPASAADDVMVTWPGVTAFNPSTTPYAVTVADPVGTGVLIAWWNETRLSEVTGAGTTALTLPANQTGRVVLTRCPAASATSPHQCWSVSTSPELSVFNRLTYRMFGLQTRQLVDGAGAASLHLYTEARLDHATMTATWELVEESSGTVRTSGASTPVFARREQTIRVPVTIPTGLPSASHLLRVDLTADSEAYGELDARVPGYRVAVDQVRPVVELKGGASAIFPGRDGYLDSFDYEVRADEPGGAFLEIHGPSGALLKRWHDGLPRRSTARFSWNGRLDNALLPEGVYTLRFGVTDRMMNTTLVTRSVRLSHLVRRMISFRRTVSAADSLVSRSVGRCSSLVTRGGALTLASESRCRGTDRAGTVATSHGVYIPRSMRSYTTFRVTAHGGPANASPRNYLVFGYARGKTFDNRVVFRRGGLHRGELVDRPRDYVFDRDTDRPYVIWSNGLAAGSRYVVRKYTVQIRYGALVRPGSRRYDAAPGTPQQTSASPRVAASYSS